MLDTKDSLNWDSLDAPMADAGAGRGTGERVGPYALRREIGRGGMSVVYEARDTRTGETVALKLLSLPSALSAAEADGLVARFEREARTVSRLSHPNILCIHEIGACQNTHFLAMELLQGQTLRERLAQKPLALSEAYAVLAQVAGAVDAVHAAGIVHRDVKPQNVMLLPDGTAKLLDFGIAHSVEEAAITSAGMIIGTPYYMAPEQVRGEPATTATDLWSLGVLAYELLAGYLPFAGPIVANVLFQVTSRPPAPTPRLPKSVSKVLRRALDKDPARRYLSAGALAAAIQLSLPKSALPRLDAPASKRSLPAFRMAPFRMPSFPRVTSLPKWVPGAGLALLFFGGMFGAGRYAAHPGRSAAPPQAAVRQVPAAPVSPPVYTPPPPVILLPPAPVTAALPPVPEQARTEAVAMPHNARQKAPVAASHEEAAPPEERADQMPNRRYAADMHADSERAQDAPRDPAPPPEVTQPATHMSVTQADTAQEAAPAASKTSPGLDNTVTAVLPTSGDGYDPEAEARLRKSTWAQAAERNSHP